MDKTDRVLNQTSPLKIACYIVSALLLIVTVILTYGVIADLLGIESNDFFGFHQIWDYFSFLFDWFIIFPVCFVLLAAAIVLLICTIKRGLCSRRASAILIGIDSLSFVLIAVRFIYNISLVFF